MGVIGVIGTPAGMEDEAAGRGGVLRAAVLRDLSVVACLAGERLRRRRRTSSSFLDDPGLGAAGLDASSVGRQPPGIGGTGGLA